MRKLLCYCLPRSRSGQVSSRRKPVSKLSPKILCLAGYTDYSCNISFRLAKREAFALAEREPSCQPVCSISLRETHLYRDLEYSIPEQLYKQIQKRKVQYLFGPPMIRVPKPHIGSICTAAKLDGPSWFSGASFAPGMPAECKCARPQAGVLTMSCLKQGPVTKFVSITIHFLFTGVRGPVGARTLLGAPGRTTRNKKLLGAPGIATRSKKLLGTKGIATRSKDAIRLEAIASLRGSILATGPICVCVCQSFLSLSIAQ